MKYLKKYTLLPVLIFDKVVLATVNDCVFMQRSRPQSKKRALHMLPALAAENVTKTMPTP